MKHILFTVLFLSLLLTAPLNALADTDTMLINTGASFAIGASFGSYLWWHEEETYDSPEIKAQKPPFYPGNRKDRLPRITFASLFAGSLGTASGMIATMADDDAEGWEPFATAGLAFVGGFAGAVSAEYLHDKYFYVGPTKDGVEIGVKGRF